MDEYVAEWMEEGNASWIGGCCRVYPEDITKIKCEMEKVLSKRYGLISMKST